VSPDDAVSKPADVIFPVPVVEIFPVPVVVIEPFATIPAEVVTDVTLRLPDTAAAVLDISIHTAAVGFHTRVIACPSTSGSVLVFVPAASFIVLLPALKVHVPGDVRVVTFM